MLLNNEGNIIIITFVILVIFFTILIIYFYFFILESIGTLKPRLVGYGNAISNGRLEVYLGDGAWGTVCSSEGWGQTEAEVKTPPKLTLLPTPPPISHF